MACSKCKQTFDILCANYTEDKYAAFSPEFKMSWICLDCRSKIPKGDNSHTPVRQQYIQDMSIASDSADVSLCSQDNVTVRTGTRYGQSTDKNDNMSDMLRTLQVSIMKELKEIQDDFDARLTKKISKLFSEHFHSFKTDVLERVNDLSKRMDDLERTFHECPTTNNVSQKVISPKSTIVSSIPTANSKDRQKYRQPTLRKNKEKSVESQQQNMSAPISRSDVGSACSSANHVGKTRSIHKPNEGEWTEVRRRLTTLPVRASLPGMLRGTAAHGATSLCAAEKKTYVHLYYVKEGTTVEQVNAHLITICGADVCLVEALKARGNYASFKIAIPSKLSNIILNPENWAVDICVKLWRQNFRNKQNFRNEQERK